MMIAKVLSRGTFVPTPGDGVGVLGGSYYTTLKGGNLVRVFSFTSRSDTVDVAYIEFSEDNGRTWNEPAEWQMKFKHPKGTGRRHPRGGYVDPATGRYISIWTEGVLPTDEPLEGMRHWTLHYSVSEDGGKTWRVSEQIVHEGDLYDEIHHLPGVTVGKNCVMIGDLGQRPMTRSDGVILVPVQSSPVGPDGDYINPGGGFTYTDCMLLMGRWQVDGRLAWRTSERVAGNPQHSTRGMCEPTIAELGDGSLLMIMRGSNDARPELPGYRWMARSGDGGQTWTQPEPWTYTDGTRFHSPSSCSQLITCSNGRLLWMGNICRQNPRGNRPRYPIVLAEVDQKSGLLLKKSVTIIDDRQPGESELLTLSNFYVRQDRETGDLLLHLPRFFSQTRDQADQLRFTTDLYLYRIELI
ncbi:exo-alpha-sialidase [candidate division KSB1 bacterium]|nr:exo-alpha-sialidase [candidate division KSB1 bacterium]